MTAALDATFVWGMQKQPALQLTVGHATATTNTAASTALCTKAAQGESCPVTHLEEGEVLLESPQQLLHYKLGVGNCLGWRAT